MQALIDVFKPERTFRPQKKFGKDCSRGLLFRKAQATLGLRICMSDVVRTPPGEDKKEWIAVHAVDFFNRISLIYGTLTDRCNATTCPNMVHTYGSKRWDWRWQDNKKYKKPTQLCAVDYILNLMNWIEHELNDPVLFPDSKDTPWPRNYDQRVKRIFTRLHRVFVHVYFSHFKRIQEISGEAQVNYCYKHFWYFVVEHGLVDASELEPLNQLANRICRKHKDLPPPGQVDQFKKFTTPQKSKISDRLKLI